MGYYGKISDMAEQQYVIDCLRKDIPLEYLEECHTVDTRLTKVNTIDDEYWVLRPPSIESNRRLEMPSGSYPKVAKEFDSLLNELKGFDINIPQYQPFVSHFHTKEGSEGLGLCIASKYIHGKCLPMNECNGKWGENKCLYYETMSNWIDSMTKYSISKYLCAEDSPKFLSDVFRPIQFVYSFEQMKIFLVDLDPLFSNILENNGKVSERFLVSLTTLNSVRNRYFNKGYEDGVIDKKWGKKSKELMEKFFLKSDFLDRVDKSPYSQRILNNLISRVQYS